MLDYRIVEKKDTYLQLDTNGIMKCLVDVCFAAAQRSILQHTH